MLEEGKMSPTNKRIQKKPEYYSPQSRTIETKTNADTKDTIKKECKSTKKKPSELKIEENDTISGISERKMIQSKTQKSL